MQNEEMKIRTPQGIFLILHSKFSISSASFFVYLLALPIYCLLRLAGETEWQRMLTFTIPSLLCATGFAHAIERYGLRRALLLFVSGAIIAFIFEALGSGTGFLFGHYSYTDKLGYKLLGLVPWLIPIAWCSMLYPAWHIADVVARDANRFTRRALRIVIAALAITAWDLSLDPRMVQDGYWIWHDVGSYFGIPLSNYAGWFVTALVIYGVWAFIDHLPFAIDHLQPPQSMVNRQSSMVNLPTLAYLVVWLGESVANAVFWAGPLVGLFVFVGMGAFALPAVIYTFRRATDQTALALQND